MTPRSRDARRAAALVRLFPRIWRLRYGQEFTALLEGTRVTPGVMLNVVRLATGEWLSRTMPGCLVLGTTIAGAAMIAAFALSVLVPIEGVSLGDGAALLWLGFLPGFASIAAAFRLTASVHFGWPGVGARERSVWLTGVFGASIAGAHGNPMLDRLSTGIASSGAIEIWLGQAWFVTMVLTFLLAADRVAASRNAPKPLPRPSPSARPLGLD